MRKLLIALAIIPVLAQAEATFELKNQIGGKMILTDVRCTNGTGYIAYSTMSGYSTLTGCWTADSEFVHVLWSDGDLRSYPSRLWTYIGKSKTDRKSVV